MIWPFVRSECMFFHMKTTLIIEDRIYRRLKSVSAESGRTVSELVTAALRQFLERRDGDVPQRDLPAFNGGGQLVDVANREALCRALDGE